MSDGVETVLVDSVEEVEAFLRWLGERRPILAFDVETTGLDPWRDKVRLAQFGDAKTGWAIPYRDWRGLVRHALEIYEGPMVMHNAKFDTSMMEADDVSIARHRVHDTMTMCALVDSHGPKGLKAAARRYVGAGSGRGEQELKQAMKQAKWDWASIPETFEKYWHYGALDTVLTARLAENLWRRVQPYRDAYDLELAVTWVLLDMEQRGARVDIEYCSRMYDLMQAKVARLQAKWPAWNLLSSNQMVDVFVSRGFRLTKKTRSGALAFDEEVIQQIVRETDDELAKDVLSCRRNDKFSETYLGAFLRFEVDGIVHCNVNPLGAEKTGRMSISRPSFQNLPRRKIIRDAIIPHDGEKIVLTDYQAQETRLIAHFAREQGMIGAFNRGEDIHTFVASMVYGVPVGEVTKEQRRKAKQCGHARNYGAGAPKLALTADISLAESREFAKLYDMAFPRIQPFNISVQRAVRDRDEGGYGYVMSYSGRKIRVPVEKAYVGTNFLVQGSGSDALKKGLVNADRSGISGYAVLPVHDEVVWSIPEDDITDVLNEIRLAFEHDDLSVPLPIEHKIVDRWGAAYE